MISDGNIRKRNATTCLQLPQSQWKRANKPLELQTTKKILIRNAELLKKESENEKKLFCLCEKVFQSKQYVQKLDPCIFLSETVYNV